MIATKKAPPTRNKVNFVEFPKAMYVENNTMGFTIGAVNIKAKAVGMGTPFVMKRLIIGTMPHSQEGKKKPNTQPTRIDANLFLGNRRLTRSGVKKTCKAPEIKQPKSTNGKASITTERKIILICNTESGKFANKKSPPTIPSHRNKAIVGKFQLIS